MSKPSKVLVVHSPHAGRAALLSEALSALGATGIEIVENISIAALDPLPAQGSHWREMGIDAVVAAGGDGLIGGVASHIVESRLPLGILPLGTANDIARSLDIPQDIRQAAERIAEGHELKIDIGAAQPATQAPRNTNASPGKNVQSQDRQQSLSYFVHVLTVGMNVEFARMATNITTRQRYGRMTYPVAALTVLRNHHTLDMELHFDDLVRAPRATSERASLTTDPDTQVMLRCRALQSTIINAPVFGGQWQLSVPGARLDDGLLDIVVVEDVDLGDLSASLSHLFEQGDQPLMNLFAWHQQHSPQLASAELTGLPGVHHLRARGVTIYTQADPQDATLDGEVRGQTPIRVQLAPTHLTVLGSPAAQTS